MKLKSKKLIEFFGTDEPNDRRKRVKGLLGILEISDPDFSKPETIELFSEIRELQKFYMQDESKALGVKLRIGDIKSKKDLETILENLDSHGIKYLELKGNFDGADFSKLSNFEDLVFLIVKPDHKFWANKIALPPNLAEFELGDNIKFENEGLKNKSIYSRKIINNVTELSLEELDKEEYNHIEIDLAKEGEKRVTVTNYIYSPEEYKAILSELHNLTDDIPKDLPQDQKVMAIYERISSNIEYDYPAVYPENEEEEEYSKKEINNSGSLKNGLLYGKAVCAGYAEIMRNACLMVGLEAECADGFLDRKEKGGWHRWTKVKIDGEWYNFDPCWDHDQYKEGKPPEYAFERDIDRENNNFSKITGPKCDTVHKSREGFFSKIKNFINKFRRKDKILALPEATESKVNEQESQANEVKSWDLSNWGIDKEQFMVESAESIKKHNEEIVQKKETKDIETEER